jgi:Transposase IS4
MLADCSLNYLLRFIIYTGETTRFLYDTKKIGLGAAAVLSLLKNYFNKGHSLFADNFFMSPWLVNKLLAKNINSLGTARLNRKNMPNFEKKS